MCSDGNPAAAILVVGDTELILLRDVGGDLSIARHTASCAAERADQAPSGAGIPIEVDDLLLGGGIHVRPLHPADGFVVRRKTGPSRNAGRLPAAVAAKRRLVACRMCDAAGVPQGCKAIERFLHAAWTNEVVQVFGPRPKARTVRLWRASDRKGSSPPKQP